MQNAAIINPNKAMFGTSLSKEIDKCEGYNAVEKDPLHDIDPLHHATHQHVCNFQNTPTNLISVLSHPIV
jgi:hypothetical protein